MVANKGILDTVVPRRGSEWRIVGEAALPSINFKKVTSPKVDTRVLPVLAKYGIRDPEGMAERHGISQSSLVIADLCRAKKLAFKILPGYTGIDGVYGSVESAKAHLDESLSLYTRKIDGLSPANLILQFGHLWHTLGTPTPPPKKIRAFAKKFEKLWKSRATGTHTFTIPLARLIEDGFDMGEGKRINSLVQGAGAVISNPGNKKTQSELDYMVKQLMAMASDEPNGEWIRKNIIETFPMPIDLGMMEVRDTIYSDCGVVPKRMANLCSSGNIFERVYPEKGATIVLDGSGSMSLEDSDILDFIKGAPASTIAVYSAGECEYHNYKSTDRNTGDGNCAHLCIVAKNGRMASLEDERYRVGCGNGMDGLALRWLASQEGPRFWVSDGQVVGAVYNHDGTIKKHVFTKKLFAECISLCKQHDISWVYTPGDLGLALKEIAAQI